MARKKKKVKESKGNPAATGERRTKTRFRSRMDPPEGRSLTVYEWMFVKYFLGEASGNRTRAARMCGFANPRETGYHLINQPTVRAAIRAKMDQAAMSSKEVLIRLSEQAASSIEDCMSRGPHGWRVDLDKAKRMGKMHLIKKVTPTAHGLSIEMYPADAAREQLMRYHGLFQDRLDVTHTMKIDMAALAAHREGLELLHRFSKGEINHEEFYAHARPLLEHNPSPAVIDGQGLVHEVPDPLPDGDPSDGASPAPS
jgi:hypothetical protein